MGDTAISRHTPTKVGDKTWKSIACGGLYTIAIDTEGYLYAWGHNLSSQLGLGDTKDRYTPTKVGDKTWKSIACGADHTIAIDTEGYLYAWGEDLDGQLGFGTVSEDGIYTPTKVGDKTWKSIACGNFHTIAIDTEGYLYAWGSNDDGQLGLGDTKDRYTPTKVGDKTWKSIACDAHTIAIEG